MDAAHFFREQVRAAIPKKFKHETELAAKAGISQSSLNLFMNGKRDGMELDTIWKLIDALGLEISPKEKPTIQRTGAHSPKIVIWEGEDGKLIDVYQVAGAGQAWEIVEVEPLKSIQAPLSFAAQISFALLVKGDSTHPTLKSGCVVGVKQDESFISNEIFAVNPPDEGLSVKRVVRDYERDGYILRSDNVHYKDTFVPKALAEHLLVGRVVWVWQGV